MDDNDVVAIAEELLRQSPYDPLRRIKCVMEQGELCLYGTLASYHHKQLALAAVMGKINGTSLNITGLQVTRTS